MRPSFLADLHGRVQVGFCIGSQTGKGPFHESGWTLQRKADLIRSPPFWHHQTTPHSRPNPDPIPFLGPSLAWVRCCERPSDFHLLRGVLKGPVRVPALAWMLCLTAVQGLDYVRLHEGTQDPSCFAVRSKINTGEKQFSPHRGRSRKCHYHSPLPSASQDGQSRNSNFSLTLETMACWRRLGR